MPSDPAPLNSLIIPNTAIIFKFGIIIFAFLYFIFTLIVIRQVGLMTETVKTQAGILIKLVSIMYALFALGVVIFFFVAL